MVLFGILMAALLCSCNAIKINKTGSLTWELKDGILTISGQGPMPNYDHVSSGPWRKKVNGIRPDITSIIINEGVTNIGNNAFAYHYDNVVSVSIPGSVTNIGENAFRNCKSIISVIIPDGVINIDNYAFQDCSKLISIEIPDSVINIGGYAFNNCNGLLTVSLGKNVKYIGIDAFRRCSNILTVTSSNPIPPYLETRTAERGDTHYNINNDYANYINRISAFDSVTNKCRLVVPDEFIAAYREDTEWNKFFNDRAHVIYQRRIFFPSHESDGGGIIWPDDLFTKTKDGNE
jgi:hypothetical protein